MRSMTAGLLMVGLLAFVASAQEASKEDRPPAPPTVDEVRRLVWEHAERLCQFIDKGDDNWVEVDKTGNLSFQFKETRRNCDFVDLFDKSRGYTLRLYKNAMYIKGGADGGQPGRRRPPRAIPERLRAPDRLVADIMTTGPRKLDLGGGLSCPRTNSTETQ